MQKSTLRLDLKVGERVRIGDVATITLEKKSGQSARITFETDRDVPIQKIDRHPVARIAAAQGIGSLSA